MRFPDWLFKLLPGDAGSQLLSVIWREATSSSVAVSVSVDPFTVPTDKCLVLTNATVRAEPGAAQSAVRRRLMADPPAGTVRYNIFDDETNDAAAATDSAFNWQGEVVVPGGWKVKAEVNFNAAAVANTINAEIHGYLIPRGSFIFG